MSTIPLGATPARPPAKGLAPFALGFRPFFLLAGLAACVLMPVWLAVWFGTLGAETYYSPLLWHSHEMLFGYAVAVIAGFLLTAVRNWTGIDTPTGWPLALLAVLWLAGRLAPWAYPWLPGLGVALLDGAFLPALIWGLARPLWRGANRVNRVFLPLLGGMALANLLYHLQALGIAAQALRGQQFMLYLVLLLVALVGGRVMPFFTEKAVAGAAPKRSRNLERWSYVVLVALLVLALADPPGPLSALVLGLAALTQGLRLWGWYDPGVWRIPILWVLYTGYAWLVLGFALQSLAAANLFPPNLALHALTAGGFGVLTLGMMSRVALGHTGRELRSSRAIDLAYLAVNLAVAVRVFGPLILENQALPIYTSGGLWIGAFALFSFVYLPILLKPRADGRPG